MLTLRRLILLVLLTFNSSLHATDFSAIFAKVDPTVVVVKVTSSKPQITPKGLESEPSSGLGTGVIVNKDGSVMTAAHVVQGAESIQIELLNGEKYSARIESFSGLADLAMLKLDDPPKNLSVATLGNSDQIKTGEEVFVIGTPYGLGHTLTIGHLSGRRIQSGEDALMDLEFLQTDASVNRGNSGGPLFDSQGRLIGIVSHIVSQSGGSQGLGFAGSINMAKRVLINEAPIWLGIDTVFVRGELADALNIDNQDGLLVQTVAKNSLGEKLGLRGGVLPAKIQGQDILLGGDVIVQVGGENIYLTRKGRERNMQYLRDVPKGGTLQLTVVRNGKREILSTLKP